MSSPEPGSLSGRLFAALGTGLATVLGLLLLLFWIQAGTRADRTYDRLLESAAMAMLDHAVAGPGGTDIDLPASAFATLAFAAGDRVIYRVTTAGGREITGDPGLALPRGYHPRTEPVFRNSRWTGEKVRMLTVARPVQGADGLDWMILQLGQTRLSRNAEMQAAFAVSAAGLAAVTALCLLLLPVAARAALAPLAVLSRDIAARDPGDLAPVAAAAPDEVARLVAALNAFMARLAGAQASRETFIADVAHQLRSGLAALQGRIELVATAADRDEIRAQLVAAEAQSRRTVRLTAQLLSQAMVIHRGKVQPLKPAGMRPLLRGLLAELLREPPLSRAEIAFEDRLAEGDPARVACDPVSLREALRNLLGNACNHGPPGTGIVVALDAAPGGGTTLSVEDDGPGIPGHRRSELLERFASAGVGRGSGLGLAIVSEVARAHGTRLRLEDSAAGGLAVRLDFPQAPDPGPRLPRRAIALGLAAGLAGLAAPTLILWSATDTDVFARILEAFADVHPDIAVDYQEIGTLPLHRKVAAGMEPPPDLVISPALDLQVELVNRGLARALPGRAPAVAPGTSWRSELFCFTLEPEVVLLNRAAFAGLPQPRSHAALAALMRNRGDLLAGRLATYDIRRSAIGHLLSSQKAGLGPDQARLTEIMGRTGTRLFATSAEMFRATATGEVLIATGVLGSYADALARHDPRTEILLFDDYNLAVPRSGLVHRGARQPEAAGLLLRFLLSVGGQAALADAGLMPLSGPPDLTGAERATLMPLHPGPQMLLWQDRRKRERHLAAWADSIRAD